MIDPAVLKAGGDCFLYLWSFSLNLGIFCQVHNSTLNGKFLEDEFMTFKT